MVSPKHIYILTTLNGYSHFYVCVGGSVQYTGEKFISLRVSVGEFEGMKGYIEMINCSLDFTAGMLRN